MILLVQDMVMLCACVLWKHNLDSITCRIFREDEYHFLERQSVSGSVLVHSSAKLS
jgi:hypothetical protein